MKSARERAYEGSAFIENEIEKINKSFREHNRSRKKPRKAANSGRKGEEGEMEDAQIEKLIRKLEKKTKYVVKGRIFKREADKRIGRPMIDFDTDDRDIDFDF